MKYDNKTEVTVFGASWCTGCKQLKGVLEMNNVLYSYVDIDANPALAKEYNVRSLPTTVVNAQGVRTVIAGNKPMDVLTVLKGGVE